jgi:hypothetical protein
MTHTLGPDYAEALRLIRKHMQPGDTLGMMFMRVAKELEATERPTCPTCFRTDKEYQDGREWKHGGMCGNPWHGDEHLRRRVSHTNVDRK